MNLYKASQNKTDRYEDSIAFDVFDARGRMMGIWFDLYTVDAEVVDTSTGSYMWHKQITHPGKWFAAHMQVTRSGERFGASQGTHHFESIAKRDAFFARRIETAKKRAIEQSAG